MDPAQNGRGRQAAPFFHRVDLRPQHWV